MTVSIEKKRYISTTFGLTAILINTPVANTLMLAEILGVKMPVFNPFTSVLKDNLTDLFKKIFMSDC